jgi:hypothetical protein
MQQENVEKVPVDEIFIEESEKIPQEAWDKLYADSSKTIDISRDEAVTMYAGTEAQDKSYKEKKFVALYKARTIISHIGTMSERQSAKRQLKRMKELGLNSL